MLNRFFLILLGLGFTLLSAQDQAPKNWFNLDPKQDGFPGLSTESLYNRLRNMTGKKGETVVVAVIDSGVDYEHEDLKSVMWINPGEVAGDVIDNDKN
jgi:subtilisin family serine protease